jgi:hypothetical protein
MERRKRKKRRRWRRWKRRKEERRKEERRKEERHTRWSYVFDFDLVLIALERMRRERRVL